MRMRKYAGLYGAELGIIPRGRLRLYSLLGAGFGAALGAGLGLYGHYMHNIANKPRDVAMRDKTTRFLARHSLATTIGTQLFGGGLAGALVSGVGYGASALSKRHPARTAAILGGALGALPGLGATLII